MVVHDLAYALRAAALGACACVVVGPEQGQLPPARVLLQPACRQAALPALPVAHPSVANEGHGLEGYHLVQACVPAWPVQEYAPWYRQATSEHLRRHIIIAVIAIVSITHSS